VYVCCAWHNHLTILLYAYTVLRIAGFDQYVEWKNLVI
jgi:hypothetical protein